MVQFGDKNCSSMLALCTHAVGDAYNYANRVESHKALFEAEKPCSPPRYYSALFSCVEPPPLLFCTHCLWRKPTDLDGSEGGLVQQACICNKRRTGKEASRGNISKVRAGWNGSFLTELNPSAAVCLCIHQHIEWSVKPLNWLITDCLRCGQVSTQLRALQRVGAVIIRCKWCVYKHPQLCHFFLFFPYRRYPW